MQKQIYIHVGPPKTGTSIIQSWLNKNRLQLLSESNVYYPSHDIDQNHISSGHNQLFLEKREGQRAFFCHEKFQLLLDDFSHRNVDILLLSSEYFFYQIPEFLKYSNQYRLHIIAYIRPEYEFIESIYNQSVKRNFQDMPIALRKNIRYSYLDTLIEYLDKYSKEFFILRAYGAEHFFEPNIVHDLLETLNVPARFEIDIQGPGVNTSYSFECLEFKRWLNKFKLSDLDVLLDRMLQTYGRGEHRYSLLPQDIYDRYKLDSIKKIEKIHKHCTISEFDKLVDYIGASVRPSYMHQELHDVHLQKVFTFLLKQNYDFCNSLYTSINELPNLSDMDKHRLVIMGSQLKDEEPPLGFIAKFKNKFAKLKFGQEK